MKLEAFYVEMFRVGLSIINDCAITLLCAGRICSIDWLILEFIGVIRQDRSSFGTLLS